MSVIYWIYISIFSERLIFHQKMKTHKLFNKQEIPTVKIKQIQPNHTFIKMFTLKCTKARFFPLAHEFFKSILAFCHSSAPTAWQKTPWLIWCLQIHLQSMIKFNLQFSEFFIHHAFFFVKLPQAENSFWAHSKGIIYF